jgi:histidyl-tRNA synthetase
MAFAPPRGMRDFYPEEMTTRTALFEIWRRAARLHGFEEYDAPVVETEELLIRKGGEDIVRQIYSFEDKSGRRLALRPEMTPSLARLVLSRQNALSYPLKWFSIPQCFRYERMTKGRKREHYQLNLDIIGEENVYAETEVLSAAIHSLQLAGLREGDFFVRVGSRALLGDLFDASGIPTEKFEAVCLALDKRDKQPADAIAALLASEGLTAEEIKKAFELLEIGSLEEAAGFLKKKTAAFENVADLFSLLDDYGLGGFICFDISIVRGLAYYTGIVFEAFDAKRRFRAIFGGGRYDNLVSSLGGKPIPCVGLGFGDVVVCELLSDLGRPLAGDRGADVQIGFLSDEERGMALEAVRILRGEGCAVNVDLAPSKAKKFFARASKAGARHAIYLGPSERKEGLYPIKDLTEGTIKKAEAKELSTIYCANRDRVAK